MIVDTDVLIWYMKGNERAFEVIEDLNHFSISVVTYMELVQGMRNKKELNSLRQALKSWNTQIIYISENISAKAVFFMEQHFLSHSMQLADALVCATAITCGEPILTANDRHYKILKNLQIKKIQAIDPPFFIRTEY